MMRWKWSNDLLMIILRDVVCSFFFFFNFFYLDETSIGNFITFKKAILEFLLEVFEINRGTLIFYVI